LQKIADASIRISFTPTVSHLSAYPLVTSTAALLNVGRVDRHRWLRNYTPKSHSPLAALRLENKLLLSISPNSPGGPFFTPTTHLTVSPNSYVKSPLQFSKRLRVAVKLNSIKPNQSETRSPVPPLVTHPSVTWRLSYSLLSTSHELLGSLPKTPTRGEATSRWVRLLPPYPDYSPRKSSFKRARRKPYIALITELIKNPLTLPFRRFLSKKLQGHPLSLVSYDVEKVSAKPAYRFGPRMFHRKKLRSSPLLKPYKNFNLSFTAYQLKMSPNTFFKTSFNNFRSSELKWLKRNLRLQMEFSTAYFSGFHHESKLRVKRSLNNYPREMPDYEAIKLISPSRSLRLDRRSLRLTLKKIRPYVINLRYRANLERLKSIETREALRKRTHFLIGVKTAASTIYKERLLPSLLVAKHIPLSLTNFVGTDSPHLIRSQRLQLTKPPRRSWGLWNLSVNFQNKTPVAVTKRRTTPTPKPITPLQVLFAAALPLFLTFTAPSTYLNPPFTLGLPSFNKPNPLGLTGSRIFNWVNPRSPFQKTRLFALRPSHSITFTRSPFFFIQFISSPFDARFDLVTGDLSVANSFHRKYHIFPDANTLKVRAFRAINNKKKLLDSRVERFSEASLKFHSNASALLKSVAYPLSLPSSSAATATPSHFFKTIFAKKLSNSYLPSENSSIRRVRFKPGYGRIWRIARTSIRELIGCPCRYQYRLSPKLTQLYLKWRNASQEYVCMALDQTLMSSHLLPDYWCVDDALSSGHIFLNGRLVHHKTTNLFINDFLQLTVNLRFYIALKWLRYWSNFRKNRVNRVFYSKHRPSGTNRHSRFTRPLPHWFFDLRFSYRDVPQNVEVDFFTLSIFVLRDSLPDTLSDDAQYPIYDPLILNMYNWKYVT